MGWLLVAGVCVGSLLPGRYVAPILASDKLVHSLSYFLLMIWFCGLYRRSRHTAIAALLFALGFALDWLQGAYFRRSFDLADVAANASGILAAWVLCRFVLEGWCHRVERFFLAG